MLRVGCESSTRKYGCLTLRPDDSAYVFNAVTHLTEPYRLFHDTTLSNMILRLASNDNMLNHLISLPFLSVRQHALSAEYNHACNNFSVAGFSLRQAVVQPGCGNCRGNLLNKTVFNVVSIWLACWGGDFTFSALPPFNL